MDSLPTKIWRWIKAPSSAWQSIHMSAVPLKTLNIQANISDMCARGGSWCLKSSDHGWNQPVCSLKSSGVRLGTKSRLKSIENGAWNQASGGWNQPMWWLEIKPWLKSTVYMVQRLKSSGGWNQPSKTITANAWNQANMVEINPRVSKK